VAFVASLPLLSGVLAAGFGAVPSGAAWGWLGTYSALTLLFFAAARRTFDNLLTVSHIVQKLFFEPTDAAPVTFWLKRQTHWTRWLRWLLATAVAIAGGVWGAIHFDQSRPAGLILSHGHAVIHPVQVPEAGVAWFIATGLTIFWAGDTVSWLVRIPLLVHRLQLVRRLRVIVHAPVQTPAIRELSAFLSKVDVSAATGLFLFAAPLVWAVLLALHHASTQVCLTPVTKVASSGGVVALVLEPHHCPHPWSLVWVSAIPLALTLALNVYVTFVSQWWLSQVVEKQRNWLADEAARGLVAGEVHLADPYYVRRRELYDIVAGANTRTIQGRAIFRRAIIVLGSVTPYLGLFATRIFHLTALFVGLKPSGKT
jgi:hypothetical protein